VTTVDIIYRYEARDTSTRPLPSDSNAALVRLNDGNRDFAALLDHVRDESGVIQQIIPVDPRDLGLASGAAGTPKQRPFAAILGCSDARVPIELIFNEGPNDLFVIRVAGNGLGTEVLGSLKYAAEQLGGTLKLIAVLGHSGCGALTTAVDVFLNPGDYLALAAKHSLRNILDRSLLAVQASANKLLSAFGSDVTSRLGYRQALIEASIVTNAALSAYSIQQEFVANQV
jgi:carbonic anhydrase